jgi:hypothetical protein
MTIADDDFGTEDDRIWSGQISTLDIESALMAGPNYWLDTRSRSNSNLIAINLSVVGLYFVGR